jgi:hypothetical protein
MLNLFRNIRKNFLSKSSTDNPSSTAGRYFLYAIGEIFLVMIGILLALQVNNWNQKRLDSIKEKQLLSSIYEEMRQLDFFQESGYRRYRDVVFSAKNLLLAINDPSAPISKEQLDAELDTISNIRWLTGASYVTNIYDLLIGSGQWDLLSSEKIRHNLKMLNSHLEFLLTYEEFQANFVDSQLSPFLNEYIDRLSISQERLELDPSIKNGRFETSYQHLLESQKFSNLLVELIRHTRVIVNTYARMGKQISVIDSCAIAGNPSIKTPL